MKGNLKEGEKKQGKSAHYTGKRSESKAIIGRAAKKDLDRTEMSNKNFCIVFCESYGYIFSSISYHFFYSKLSFFLIFKFLIQF